MKKVDLSLLRDASARLLFSMKEEEYLTLLEEFKILVKQMEKIGKIEGLEDYEPMTFPFDVAIDELREDEPAEVLARGEALENAGSTYMGQIKIAKVVG